ncbi:hypothetical protein DCW30_10550 [Streptomyces alfalfae]|nr:hypothetical protein D3X13_16800 [Streptomyces fradiae]RXX44892.1 hypothetical protein DCW30_10550 [Streptomyces alfalfae]RZM95313.1 hypothetical protein D4104_17265 [Streptomyces alfalfae]
MLAVAAAFPWRSGRTGGRSGGVPWWARALLLGAARGLLTDTAAASALVLCREGEERTRVAAVADGEGGLHAPLLRPVLDPASTRP